MKAAFVIPSLNNGSVIEECVSSILNYEPYISDLVVVDGGSEDNTLQALRRYPVRVMKDPGIGQPLAYEIGWRSTSGDVVVFLDADAYLGKGFFPKGLDFFSQPQVGIVGCNVNSITTNWISRTEAQWSRRINTKLDLRKAVDLNFANKRGSKSRPPLGPCQLVRRDALESVDGYTGLSVNLPTDVSLSRRILEGNWQVRRWDAPVYHHTRDSIRGLFKQHLRWGREGAAMCKEPEFEETLQTRLKFLFAHSASPLLGIGLAWRYKNPSHLILVPFSRYAWIIGFIEGLGSRKKSEVVDAQPFVGGYASEL